MTMPNIRVLPVKILLFSIGLMIQADRGVSAADAWPTLHNDYQRSGHTDEVVAGPYERKWWRDFHDEMIATRVEAIVAEDKVFVGTFAGHMYALNMADGKTVWKFRANGPIGASPCYDDGRLYFGSDDAFDRGTLYCLDASSGNVLWTQSTSGGIWTSPACVGQKVYVGDRAGDFHAFASEDGASLWSFPTGYMILKPASFSPDGRRIIIGSEDMHVYCLTPDGTLVWKSPKLPGLSLRDQGATIWRGLAIVRTNPADGFHTVLGRNGEMLEAIQREIPITNDDEVLLDQWGDLLLAPRPARRKAEIEGIIDYLAENRFDQTFFAFDLENGSEPWIAPVLFTSGLHNPPTPPAFNPETGELYTLARSALTHYVRGVRRYSCLMRIDRDTGRPDWIWPEREEMRWQDFPMIPDETQALGMMGDRIVGTHQGILAALDPGSGAVTPISATRDTYAGIFGPAAVPGGFEGAKEYARKGYLTGMPNEWHGPDRAILAIAAGRMFWVAGSQVVCIAGPDVEATSTGGKRPPEPFAMRLPDVVPGGNVANRGQGEVEDQLGIDTLGLEDVSCFLPVPPASARPAEGESADAAKVKLRALLEEHVAAVVKGSDGQPWAPMVLQLGISREERHFWRTTETLATISCALPFLSGPERQDAIHYLDRLVSSGVPLRKPVHSPEGARREPFLLGPGMQAFAARVPSYEASVDDLYGLWAYAHFADRWDVVQGLMPEIARLFQQARTEPIRFDPDDMERDASMYLNRRIAGLIGAVRLFDHFRQPFERDQALDMLADDVTLRVHHERSDHRLVRPTKGDSGAIHQAAVPRYVDLVPELAMVLREHAGPALDRHISGLQKALPVWYQAYGERMIGGENYISPAHLSRGLFLVWADSGIGQVDDLAAKLDQPWGRADLYYIEKITAVLRWAGD